MENNGIKKIKNQNRNIFIIIYLIYTFYAIFFIYRTSCKIENQRWFLLFDDAIFQ